MEPEFGNNLQIHTINHTNTVQILEHMGLFPLLKKDGLRVGGGWFHENNATCKLGLARFSASLRIEDGAECGNSHIFSPWLHKHSYRHKVVLSPPFSL